MKITILISKLQILDDGLTPTNQRIINLDEETGQPIEELIGTELETATSTTTVLGEIRRIPGTETRVGGRETIEQGQGHKNVQATIVALALHPPSGEGAQKVPLDHHHPGL